MRLFVRAIPGLVMAVCAGFVVAAPPVQNTAANRPQSARDATKAAAREAPGPNATTLQIDLLMNDATQGLDSQTWGRVFESLGYRVRARTAVLNDQPAVTETIRGPLRTVNIVGQIDRRGTLTFPKKTFGKGDEKALKDWLDELKIYGAQGSPAGQPHWGLTTAQFQSLFRSLGKEVEQPVKGQPLIDAARGMGFMTDVSLRIHASADDKWKSLTDPLVALQEVKGLTRGSALAVLLADHGLCFRPVRLPSGAVELSIQGKAETPDAWPVGWEPRPDVQRSEYAPELFAMNPIGFLDQPVSATLEKAKQDTGCVVALDLAGVAKKEADLDHKLFGLPQKKTAWILVLRSALTGTGLLPHIRVDEANRGFVYVAPFESRSINAE